jgi:hypothetical protein
MFHRICLAIILFAGYSAAQEVWLPTPPTAPSMVLPLPQSADSPAAIATTWFDTSDRANVRNLYNTVWTPSRTASIGWTGNIAGCMEGTTLQTWKDAVATGLNFVRNLSGISASVGVDLVTSAKDQKAALMFSANNQLSHTPAASWTCYTADGALAAANSNICISSTSVKPGCLEQYMTDSGSNNTAVGHRRWILYPQTQLFGSGDTPASGPNYSSNALWVFDGNYGGPRPATRESFVAWPSAGFFPYQLVPTRWSFSYPNANFSSATVTVTRAGIPMPVSLEQVQNGYGENTIVWYDSTVNPGSAPNVPAPANDVVYAITINNAIISGTSQSFNYQVIVFDPATAGANQPSVTSMSPASGSGVSQTFTFNFSDPSGYANLDVINVLINPFLDGRFSCYIAFSRTSNVLYLVNDAGTALLPGMPFNGTGVVSNGYCTVLGAGSSTSGVGQSLTLSLNLLFNQTTYAKDHVVYSAARNLTGGNSGWVTSGVWRVPSLTPSPTVSDLSPGSGSGAAQTFVITYRDSAGFSNISNTQLLINSDLNGNNACYLGYVRGSNLLYLVNDANSGLLPAISPNSGSGSAQNSQCILNGAGTMVTSSGTDLILTVSLSFKPGFSGAKVVYAALQTAGAFNSGWLARGIWTVLP